MKMHQMFSVHTKREELKNATSKVTLDLYFRKTIVQGNHMIILIPPFFKKHRYRKVGVFEILRFEERIPKVPFS